MIRQDCGDPGEFAGRKPIVLAQADWALRAVQIEKRLMLCSDDVNMCWPMVIRVDDYAKVANSQDGRHK
jgi:hypothetical protein